MKIFALALGSLFALNACGGSAGSVDQSKPTEVAKGFMEALKAMDAGALEALVVDDKKKKVAGLVNELKEKGMTLKSFEIGHVKEEGDKAEVKLRAVFLEKSGREDSDGGTIRMIKKDGKWLIERVKF